MGNRFGVQMMIQVPVKQKPRPEIERWYGSGGGGYFVPQGAFFSPCMMESTDNCCGDDVPQSPGVGRIGCESAVVREPAVGVSNAARVGLGSELDRDWEGLSRTDLVRDDTQHVTITVTNFFTVSGGVPSAQDVERAIADLEYLYAQTDATQRLSQATDLLSPLTGKVMEQVVAKTPYTPPTFSAAPVAEFSFPQKQ